MRSAKSGNHLKSIPVFKQDKIPGYSTAKKNCSIQGELPEKKIAEIISQSEEVCF